MINLKLAEYKDGKFERFLELGKNFLFGGDFIVVNDDGFSLIENFLIETDEWACASRTINRFLKDAKDPLSRFDGLFDGRTYGEGRFVLVRGFNNHSEYRKDVSEEDVIWEDSWLPSEHKPLTLNNSITFSCCYGINAVGLLHDFGSQSHSTFLWIQSKNNLHEKPKLWEERR